MAGKRGRPRKTPAGGAAVKVHWFDKALLKAVDKKALKLVHRGSERLVEHLRREAPIRETDLKSTTKKPPGYLRKAMRLKRTRETRKETRGGVRMAPHGHLVALGHRIVLRGSKEDTGRRTTANPFHLRAMKAVEIELPGIASDVAKES